MHLKPSSNTFPQKHNPLTGPFYIEGVERGDLLEVNIENIVPNDYGITCIIPDLGPLKDSTKWPELNKAYTKKIKHMPGPSGTTADETKASVTLSCRIIKNKSIPYARIEKEESIIQLYADKPMEEAVHSAIVNLMGWIVQDYGINFRDSYAMISILPDFRINVYQMIRDPLLKYVVGAEFPKKYLV